MKSFLVLLFLVFFTALFTWPSQLHLNVTHSGENELMISILNRSPSGLICRKTTNEEKAKMLAHMRRDEICERKRASAKLKIQIDEAIIERELKPSGLSGDGLSAYFEKFQLSQGTHEVRVSLENEGGKSVDFSQALIFKPGKRQLIEFNLGSFKLGGKEG